MKKFKTGLCEANRTVLKEYVAVPMKLQRDLVRLKPYFKLSYKYTAALKPKK